MKKKVLWFWDNFEDLFSTIFLMIMMFGLILQVVFRYLLGTSLAWTEEVSRYSFLFMIFIGTSLVAKKKAHVRVTAQFSLLPPVFQKGVLMFGDLVCLVFNCIVIYEGFKLFSDMGQHPLISPVLKWNLKYIFVIIPIAFGMQTIRIIQNYYLDFMDFRRKKGAADVS